jgi:hypothetical protein
MGSRHIHPFLRDTLTFYQNDLAVRNIPDVTSAKPITIVVRAVNTLDAFTTFNYER